MDAKQAPVKNTFIHFDAANERPAKRARAESAPPEVRAEKQAKTEENAEAEQIAEQSKPEPKEGKKPTVRWADVEPDSDDNQTCKKPRTAERKLSRSRSRSAKSTKGEAPKELSPEERHEKRAGYVAAVKETEGYKVYLGKRKAGDKKAVSAPRTPDPDQEYSKRQWENQILQWRTSLRQWGTVTVAGDKD